ncbi:DNA-binding protein [Paraburkholderia bryophila]|uniref:Uncharacterized protein n=1 Tax=Paraburkholderia bryophila TaxID=420952 RepID=A0A329BB14_9BURK|nr:DNA-binding protein [Paraburkholderia bryophila]RAS17751.1 hypothetical protein BX591_14523 [Paraburkholderia bryophila]
MAENVNETYRGYQLVIEAAPHENGAVTLRRTIARRLGQRLLVEHEHNETALHPASGTVSLTVTALRDAREAVDRLLGGWHSHYTHGANVFAGDGCASVWQE